MEEMNQNQVRNQNEVKEVLKELIFELTGQEPKGNEGEIMTYAEKFVTSFFYTTDDNDYFVNRIYDPITKHARRYVLISKRYDVIEIEFYFKPLSDKVIVTRVRYRFVN